MYVDNSWKAITSTLPICFLIGVTCIVLQHKSFLYAIDHPEIQYQQSSKQTILLYSVYITSCICALNCFLCHISNEFPTWYDLYD